MTRDELIAALERALGKPRSTGIRKGGTVNAVYVTFDTADEAQVFHDALEAIMAALKAGARGAG